MLRVVGGCVLGAFVAFGLVLLLEGLGHKVFPPPEGTDLKDPEQLKEIIHTIPLGAKISVVAAWGIAALIGGGVAAWVSKRGWAAWVIVGLMMAGAAASLIMIPHPLWMIFAAIAALLFAGVAGAKASEI